MQRTLLFFILGFSLVNCTNKDQLVDIVYYENGSIRQKKIYSSKEDTLNYMRELYFPEGTVHFRGTIINGKTEGYLYEYLKSGQLFAKSLYIDGKRNGLSSIFEEEKVVEQKLYIEDTLRLNYIHYGGQGFLVNYIQQGEPILMGQVIYNKTGEINEDSSYYYIITCPDTLTLGNKYNVNIEVFNRNQGEQKVLVDFFNTSKTFILPDGNHIVADQLQFSIEIIPNKIGYSILGGILNITDDTTKYGKQFLLHKEIFVK